MALGLLLAGCGTEASEDAGGDAADVAVEDPDGDTDDGDTDVGDAEDGDADGEQDAVAAEDDSGSVLAAAVDQSASVTSARTRFTSVFDTPQGAAEISGEGVNTADSASIEMTMSGQMAVAFGTDQLDIEVRIVDGVMYQRFPQLIEQMGADAEWLSFDLATLGPEFQEMLDAAQQTDPSQSLEVLREVAEVTEVGRETVNGTETTHYTGELDLRAAMEASGTDPAMMEGSGVDLDQPVPVGIWIDDDGMVRRYEMSMDMEGMSSTTTFEVLEYDVDVEVTAPPADVTVAFDDQMEQGQVN